MASETVTLQRQAKGAEIELKSFESFSDFEKYVSDLFGLQKQFVITDFDREAVVDDALYVSMRAGEYWKTRPKASRLFLVLDSISSPLDADVDLEVSYEPHFNTITKTGDAHFSKIPHAVAELVDNSIQATNSNTGVRTVEIEVQLGGRDANFLIVRDNGRGMNASGLIDFATYFLTQENRGVSGPIDKPSSAASQPNTSPSKAVANGKGKGQGSARRPAATSVKRRKGRICSGFISKFGVGALQAGFHIGSCLRVVTKTAAQPDVYEFVMMEAEFARRAETNSAMFRDSIKQRNPGKGKADGTDLAHYGTAKDVMERLRSEEVGRDNFTYIVLTLRDVHVQWFSQQERNSLKRELASIYHYYLHPDHCPGGIQREEASSSDDGDGGPEETGTTGDSEEPLDIVYTHRGRNGQVVERSRLRQVHDDLESRLNAASKDTFRFDMEVLHPMQNVRLDPRGLPVNARSSIGGDSATVRRVPVTGVIHYYPYDGEKETRPQARPGEEDDESTTIEAFWEGRLVPESHAAALSFFPRPKLTKKEREAVGTSWKSRIKGILFFNWHFPISNNKLRLQFMEGDLHTALNAKNIPPKHPAVIYKGPRARHIEKDFRDWLVKCHETLDVEYRFDDKMPSSPRAKHDKWRKMAFGKGEATFASDRRVKLPFVKPIVYGVINYFLTDMKVDEDEEDGRGQGGKISLQRCPEEVYGEEDACLYPVTELDPYKSMISDQEWEKEMAIKRKKLPRDIHVLLENGRTLPKKLTARTGKAKMTGVQVQITDGNKNPVVQVPKGKLVVHSYLEFPDKNGEKQSVLIVTARPYTDRALKYDKMYFLEPLNIKSPGQYKWTIAVALASGETERAREENHLLSTQCTITVLPGDPSSMSLRRDDWDVRVILENPCWLPAFTVKLRDSSKNVCAMRTYASVTVACMESDMFDVAHVSSGSATHRPTFSSSDATGPLKYDSHSWRLVPKHTGLLSASTYDSKSIIFVVKVEGKTRDDSEGTDGTRIFEDNFDVVFEPGPPSELVLLEPGGEIDGSPVATVEAGESLPTLCFAGLDVAGNRTAPAQNEQWQVELDITAAAGGPDDDGPEFVSSSTEKVAGAAATFKNLVVAWDKTLQKEGENAVVDATLTTRNNDRSRKEVASTSFNIRVKPNKNPKEAVVCLDGNPWPSPDEAERAAAGAGAAAGTGAAKAADAVGVRRSYQVGSVITGLHLRLFDQGSTALSLGRDMFEASDKKAVTCSWNPTWTWPGDGGKGGAYDRLPDLQVPRTLEELQGGLHHASVVLRPKLSDGRSTVTLHAAFAFAVHAGPAARWMAVRADNGRATDQAGPLVMTAGSPDPKVCQASFARAVKGFLPVDMFGNSVKSVPRAPEIGIEGMPGITLLPEHQCKLAKPTRPGELYQFPRALNLIGPPCEGGHLIIKPSQQLAGEDGVCSAGLAGGRSSTGDAGGGPSVHARYLRLPVIINPGPPSRVLIRSLALGGEQFSNRIEATQLAGVAISDLEVSIVDSAMNPATIPPRGLKVTLTPRDSRVGGVASPKGRKSSSRPKDLAKRSTDEPSFVMPSFTLDMAQHGASADTAAGITLAVRVEGQHVEGVEEACIRWVRQRTSAVTAIHVAAMVEPCGAEDRTRLQEPQMLSATFGQRGRKQGFTRSADGPLPALVAWLDTDNNAPFTPPAESINLALTSSASSGARKFTTLYESPVSAPESLGRPHALLFKPKGQTMEQSVGSHNITVTYHEMRPQESIGSQVPAQEMTAELVLKVEAGEPVQLVPDENDAHHLHALSASNQRSTDPGVSDGARQLVDSSCAFTATDRKGNVANKIIGPLRLRIENVEGNSVAPDEMPRLLGCDANGYIRASRAGGAVFVFEEIWLQEGMGTREGDYRLVIDSAGDPGLASWSTVFRFDTDRARLEAIREIGARLQPFQDKMREFQAALDGADRKAQLARREVETAVLELPPSLTASMQLSSQDYVACIAEAQRVLSTFEAEQRDRQAHQARPMKFDRTQRMHPEDEERIRPLGYTVELGYVEDEHTAKLLSQRAGSKMKAVYVQTKAQLDMVRRAGAGGFCDETVAVFRARTASGRGRERNAEEIASKRLPLAPLSHPGFIDYLVNMIELPDQHEGLRDTLFNALYGSMVLFDNHDNAHEYQKACKRNGKASLPILVKEDGASLERNGYMPPTKDPESLNRLKIVFAAMPATLTPGYAKTEHYIRQLQSLIASLQDLLGAEEEILQVRHSHDVDALSAKIAELQAELAELTRGDANGVGPDRSPIRSGAGSSSRTRRSVGSASRSASAKGKGKRREPPASTPRSRSSKRSKHS